MGLWQQIVDFFKPTESPRIAPEAFSALKAPIQPTAPYDWRRAANPHIKTAGMAYPPDTDKFTDQEIFAKTLWGEARGEGYVGMCAVANVIVNRQKLMWGGDQSFRAICLRHAQFSCWLTSDPNRAKLLAVTDEDNAYSNALDIAKTAMDGYLDDQTCGANSYIVRGTRCDWAEGLKPVKSIGKHDFYVVPRSK